MKDETQQRVLVDEIRSHARAIATQVRKGRDAFLDPTDTSARDSVEHRLELIAETAGKLPRSFRQANPRVPWEELGEFRFMFAHPYEDATPAPPDHERAWRFAEEQVPKIDRRLERPRFPRGSKREQA
ncbi:MAG: DUF86 domain-containing protein [Euryarchaeota archaeon]|nr:DUF86 domain-containing protein [Euryarchaeota archaeon]MDE1838089.1 DUF86 domain-containing protein [Euryarchaeota archaeon]MDE1881911.1 DUF86 domain-containing protein [Euryarchaeota archaeon]MDE2046549.1 DUF86 domain-containing protein [Thermoplasmata archaeon]